MRRVISGLAAGHEEVREGGARLDHAQALRRQGEWVASAVLRLAAVQQDVEEMNKKLARHIQKNLPEERSGASGGPRVYVKQVGLTWEQLERAFSRAIGAGPILRGWSNDALFDLCTMVRMHGSAFVHEAAPPDADRKALINAGRYLCGVGPIVMITQRCGLIMLRDVLAEEPSEGTADAPASEDELRPVTMHSSRALATRYPQLLEVVRSLLQASEQAASEKRRYERGDIGVTHRELMDHLRAKGMNISESSARRLFEPPNSWHAAARFYQSHFAVRLKGTVDTGRPNRAESHHCCAQVRLLIELSVDCPGEFCVVSLDPKAQVGLGVLAVAKHHQGKLSVSQRIIPNHHFAAPCSVKPITYLHIDTNTPTFELDRAGREHYVFPRNGDVGVYLRCNRRMPNNTQVNVRHLRQFILAQYAPPRKVPPVLLALVDNGGDVSPSSYITALVFWRLLGALELEAVVVASYAAQESPFNPVERVQKHLSTRMAGAIYGEAGVNTDAQCTAAMEQMKKDIDSTRAGHEVRATAVPLDDEERAAKENDADYSTIM
eukprot:TRINITY_DN13006_c0_g1_i1.p1 TRINITY_DN13006_c0_g1~~TRINITY_DN13006_c0_g1_i1.p1  ORF type:complete len:550 (-),score=79.09 TRINITY_DN13006_c0_g1_i1:6-1655(-)